MITLCKYLNAINTKCGSCRIRLDVIGQMYGQGKVVSQRRSRSLIGVHKTAPGRKRKQGQVLLGQFNKGEVDEVAFTFRSFAVRLVVP